MSRSYQAYLDSQPETELDREPDPAEIYHEQTVFAFQSAARELAEVFGTSPEEFAALLAEAVKTLPPRPVSSEPPPF